tara:strand:- start:1183 stop:1404 length:222 start_codon:yes stop_codon:yes gene_type:complete
MSKHAQPGNIRNTLGDRPGAPPEKTMALSWILDSKLPQNAIQIPFPSSRGVPKRTLGTFIKKSLAKEQRRKEK